MLYGLLGGYLFFLLLVTLYAGRGQSGESYLIAGRDRSWWQGGFSKYAGSVGAGWLIAYAGFAYEYGWPLNFIILGAVAGIVLYAYWAVPRIRTLQTTQAYTQGDFVYVCTNSVLAKQCLNVSTCIMVLLTLLIAAVGAASLMETFGFLGYEMALLLTIGITIGYVAISGFKAVVLTDIIQALLLLVLLVVVVGGVLTTHPVTFEVLLERRDISLLGVAILIIFGFVATFADPTRFQITYAGKDNRSVRKGMMFTIVPAFVTILSIYVLANSVYTLNPHLDSAQVFPVAIATYAPEVLIPLGILVFFIALMSTVDSYLYSLATHAGQLLSNRTLDSAFVRKITVVFGVVIIAIAWFFRDVVNFAVLSGAMLIIIAIPILYLIAGGRDGSRFIILLLGGYGGAVVGVLTLGLTPDAGAFVLLGFLLSCCVPKQLIKNSVY